jgi:choline dehydrogenase
MPFDHIVIGAGTAGCLLANRLSADRSRRVLLIEAGGRDNYHWIHIPVGYLYCIGNPRTDWLYFTEPDAGLNGRKLRYPRGKVLGGCSSINGMIYMRGQARDYDGWAQACGDDSWGWDHCLPFFKAHEDHWRGASAAHGAPGFDPTGARSGGEWRVEKQRLRWDILDAWAEAAVQAGIERTEDFNTGNNAGVGYFEVNQRRGWRWNTTKAFLQPALARGDNLQVWTDSPVVQLSFERGAQACVAPVRRCARRRVWCRSRRGRRCCCAAAPSARRRCCSVRASGRRPCCSNTASPCNTRCPVWARTCRTICRCAPSTRCKARAR